MTLSNLIRKGGLAKVATATPATLATHETASAATVAQVATVAVATPPEPAPAMMAEEEAAIRAWLVHIVETEPDIITEVLDKCRADTGARNYFLQRAGEVPQPAAFDDDRRHCAQCANITPAGLCLAARRGDITASRTYHPADHIPRRCEGYAPRADDPDKRPGRERWPGTNSERGRR